jgi:hypothetical protein
LHITFTLRDDGRLIRVISAREMHRKERSPLLERIKVAADKRDALYQSLIKTWLAKKLDSV